jgi:hypothetical protein
MPDVHRVTITVEQPKGSSSGRITQGAYIVEGGVVIMTDAAGIPIRGSDGELYSHKLRDGDDPRAIAAVLTRKIHKRRTGNGFDRPLNYPSQKIV